MNYNFQLPQDQIHFLILKYLKSVYFFVVLIFFVPFVGFSQLDDFCATPAKTDPDPPGVYSKSIDIGYLNNFPAKTFNVFFWRINKDDGSYTPGGWPITL